MKGQDEVKFTIELAKKEDKYTLCFENSQSKQYVFSKYFPVRDAIGQLGDDRGNKRTIWIILGFGLGYMIWELLNTVSHELEIIVIEPNSNLLQEQMEIDNNRELLTMPNVHIMCDEEPQELRSQISKWIRETEVNNIRVVPIEGYIKYFLEYYKEAKKVIDEVRADIIINRNTISLYSELFVGNIIRNRKAIEKSFRLDALKGSAKDIPAVIVSAGPSLNKNIKFIKDFKGMIFAGNRTLPAVLNEGVKPDFMLAVDPNPAVLKTTRGTIEDDIPMICNDSADACFVNAHHGKKYFINTQGDTKNLLGIDIVDNMPMGGSVATLCVSVAKYMGCNPIIFIGQDCAYTDMKVHADICSNALIDQSMTNSEKERKGKRIEIDGYYGDKVLSSLDLIGFLRWFEKFIGNTPNTLYINATEGGANIKGAVNRPFEKVVEEYQQVVKPNLSQYDKRVETKEDTEEYLRRLVQALHIVTKEAKKAQVTSKNLENEYRIFQGNRVSRIRQCIKQLDKVDEIIKQKEEISYVTAMLFSRLQINIYDDLEQKEKVSETTIEEGLRLSKESMNLYRNIQEACAQLINLIEKNIDVKYDEKEMQ